METAKSTEAFVLEQAPDVARQIIAWGTAQAWMGIIAGGVILLLATLALVSAYIDWEDHNDPIIRWLLGGIGVPVGLLMAGINVATLVKINTAPKLYLLEQVSRLL